MVYWSRLHPSIAGGAEPIWGEYSPEKTVNKIITSYTDAGYLRKRRKSEKLDDKSRFEALSLMSLEGAVLPSMLNALAGYKMFGEEDSKSFREAQVQTYAEPAPAQAQAQPQQIPTDVANKIQAFGMTTQNIGPQHATSKSKDLRDAHATIHAEQSLLPATTANLLDPDQQEDVRKFAPGVAEEHEALAGRIRPTPSGSPSRTPPSIPSASTEPEESEQVTQEPDRQLGTPNKRRGRGKSTSPTQKQWRSEHGGRFNKRVYNMTWMEFKHTDPYKRGGRVKVGHKVSYS